MTAPELRPPADLELDAYLAPFEAAAARGDEPDPADYLPPPGHPKYGSVLCELVRLDLEFAWDRGEERRVECYADRFPALFADPALLAAVAAEEYRLRRAAGEEPARSEYFERLRVEIGGSAEVGSRGPVWDGSALPEIGTYVPPGFRIRSELGRGAFGRVYLAEQPDLAGRLVAVKVSSRLVGEAQTLARLQHTHIVPVYAVHRVGGYQLLVMPFLGSATLADLVRTIRGSGTVPATGRAIRTVIASHASEVGVPTETSARAPEPANDALVAAPYVDTILDFGIAIADGLAHAHARGILHRDLKPANILLTEDGRPMLLDFNLAADDRSGTKSVGGTPRYMAPEQLAALSDAKVPVDARADVYALGLVLYELLAGRLPFPEPDAQGMDLIAKLREDRLRLPAIDLPSPAVTAVLKKCLAPAPGDRYSSAAELRDDLARHRSDRPLVHTREPWTRERLRKFAHRHPRLTSGSTVALAAVLVLGVVVTAAYSLWRHNATLEARGARNDVRALTAGVRGLVVDPSAPGEQLKLVHKLSRDVLRPYHVADPHDWRSVSAVRRLPADEADAIRGELTELLVYVAEASGELADRESDSATQTEMLKEALALNAQAAEVDPGLYRSVLLRQRARLLRQPVPIDLPDVNDAWLTGWGELREKRYAAAAAHFERIVNRNPDFPAWMALGTARLRLGQFDRAGDAFFAAAALEPGTAAPHFYRGVALLGAERFAAAVDELDRYIRQTPDEPDGWLNRAIARFRLGEFLAAIADLGEAERLGQSPTRVFALRLQVWQARGEASKVTDEYRRLLASRPESADAWTVRAEARLTADPAGAIDDFDAALKLEPEFLAALRGKASCLSENLHRPADAAVVLEIVMRHPGARVEDRAASAVLLARLGRSDLARSRARECLGPDTPPIPLYQAASALALTSQSAAERSEVVAILRRVLKGDAAWAKLMPDDPDLKAVHGDPAFRALVAAGNVIEGTDHK